jgi:hypothetical protein
VHEWRELRRLRDHTAKTLFIVLGLKYIDFRSATALVGTWTRVVLARAGTRTGKKREKKKIERKTVGRAEMAYESL